MCKVQPEIEPYQGKWSYTKSNEKLKSDGDSCTKEIVQSIHSAKEMKAADLQVMERAFQNFKSPLKNVLIKSGIFTYCTDGYVGDSLMLVTLSVTKKCTLK